MKLIRSRDKSGRDAYYDAEYLRRLDAEQGRRQLNAAEVEAMIAMSVARQLAEDAWEVLKTHAECSGAAQRLRTAIPMIRNANVLMTNKVRGQQLLTTGAFEEAEALFAALGNYKNAAEKVEDDED